MPVWRCPHCGASQPESSRCWVCHRSTTSCGTCRHFRHGVAGGLGLCGIAPRGLAIQATDVRPCWAAPASVPDAGDQRPRAGAAPGASAPTMSGGVASRPARTFVPVDELQRADAAQSTADDPSMMSLAGSSAAPGAQGEGRPRSPVSAVTRPGTAEPRWSLWGDPEA